MKKLLMVLSMAVLPVLAAAVTGISPEQLSRMQQDGTPFVLLDIRSDDAYRDGHLQNARHVGWDGRAFSTAYAPYIAAAGTPVVIICADGTQAPAAAGVLAGAGYTDVSYVTGGMAAAGGILSMGTQNIRSWHVIKSLFAGDLLPK